MAENDPNNPAPPAAPPATQGDPSAAFQRLLERNNSDALRLAEQLYRENHDYRERNRTLQGQLPAQGAVVLSSEDAARWQQYTQLGAIPDLQTAIQERQTLQTELATLKQDAVLRDVADTAKVKFSVLKTVGAGLEYVIKDETVSGKPAKVVYIKDGETETKLDDYANTHWADFLPALRAQTETPRPAIGTPQRVQTQQQQTQAQTPQQTDPRRRVRL